LIAKTIDLFLHGRFNFAANQSQIRL